jgi:hypothetical protein
VKAARSTTKRPEAPAKRPRRISAAEIEDQSERDWEERRRHDLDMAIAERDEITTPCGFAVREALRKADEAVARAAKLAATFAVDGQGNAEGTAAEAGRLADRLHVRNHATDALRELRAALVIARRMTFE